ncbi:MAG: hypothetical protein JWN76_1273 [Chitinophagaceae bacterium]|nr:hypothetical protein [Chitinophagaceae bacterium]
MNGWVKHSAVGATGTTTFVNGPSPAPLGNGSVEFYCPDKKFIRLKNDKYVGTLVSVITELSYSTYIQKRDSTVDNIFVVLQIDIDADGIVDYPLVFTPCYQTGHFITGLAPDQGATKIKTWQTWDLLKGVWWKGSGADPDNGGLLFTWASFIKQFPKATIMDNIPTGPGSIRLGGGSPVFSGVFVGNADKFKIGINGLTTTYDFEGM